MNNGNTVEAELKRHSKILANCLMEELDKLYSSYSPSIYSRAYDLYNSVCVDNNIRVNVRTTGAELSIRVFFDEGAIHDNLAGNTVNAIPLLDNGWRVKKDVWFKDIYHFGYYDGFHFIEKEIKKYRNRVDNPFKVKVNIM